MPQATNSNKKTILLVDDEPSILKLLEFILKNDYELVIRNNAFDALNWLDLGNIPDLIISDMEMPYFDGGDFVRALKVSGFFRKIPLIVLTGSDSVEGLQKKLPYDIGAFVIKPFNPGQLKEKITALLQ